VSTGVFTYSVQLDNAADLKPGDGFVIYDFPDLVSSSLTASVGSLTGSQFSLTQTLTSNVLTDSSDVDSNGFVAALADGLAFDNPGTENLSFVYEGPPNPFVGSATSTLTLTSSITGSDTTSVYGSVDHSGPSQSIPFSFSANSVTVPVPEPVSSLGLAVVGGVVAMRRRRSVAR